ncbi:ABC transporter permease [Nonomuraea insulae]|uniref:ABC transporter permease n=1 Tax=Nonomuraea insulae TaxID=1616787 RepID=A0ABW1CGS2_9ACTN
MRTAAAAPDHKELEETRAVAARHPVLRWVATGGAWVFLLDLLLILIFGLLSDDQVFWSLQNAQALLLGGTEALLLALGLAMLLGAGVFDLSLGANLVLSSIVGARVIQLVAGTAPDASGQFHDAGTAILLGLLACVLTGTLFGLINGLIIAYLDVNSLIATLGTMGVGTGLGLLITNGGDLGGLPPALQTGFGLFTLAHIPVPALVAILIGLALWTVLRYLKYGMRTLAIGSSRAAAERAGLRVRPHLVSLAVLAGTLAGLAGFVDISRFGSTTVSGHSTDALTAVTAVVIGGTLLEGGRVSIPGAMWGTILAVVLQGGLVILGVKPFFQLIAIGVVLVAAVAIDRIRYKRREAR